MLNDLAKVALAKLMEKDTKGVVLAPGVHNVDETVVIKLQGTITKGAQVTYTPTVDIPMLTTLALVLEKSGFQRERSKALLVEAMTEALTIGDKGSEHVAERVKDIEAAMGHVREVTEALPKKTKQGATKVEVELTAIDF
jgi:hypothetical protein